MKFLSSLNPRRSLAAAAIWLIVGLAMTFSLAAAIWVGNIARKNVLEQHVRRLSLETDQLGTDLSQALVARLDAVRSTAALSRADGGAPVDVRRVFEKLEAAYPHLEWLAAADARGVVIASRLPQPDDAAAHAQSWALAGLRGLWLYVGGSESRASSPSSNTVTELGDVAIPVHDDLNRPLGVVASHVSWRRAANHPERLTDEPNIVTEVSVLDQSGLVLLGPRDLVGKPWPGVAESSGNGLEAPRFERLPDGHRVLIASSPLSATDEINALGWRVQLSDPNERVFQRANAVALRILEVSLFLGVLTCVLGILGVRQLTRRLQRLALSVASVGQESKGIEVPTGADEVARLGHAFSKLLEELAQERGELEHRVAVRTREVERLADESRYAAIVRERLRIARDLHDTLAHSMMAILSEIRFLRRLQDRDPKALAKELARAELIAHEGLQEARRAITQMRATAVRESGLGPALAEVFERFVNSTGITGEFQADDAGARFGDERAETLVRMAQEILRNIERHAKATKVSLRLSSDDETTLTLQIEDNGVGFEPEEIPAGHFGILGLREQADLIGAELVINSKPEQGTLVRVVLRVSPVVF
jgi:signal transduction histidine kinase